MKCSVCGNESEANPCVECKKKFGDLLDQKVVDSVHTQPELLPTQITEKKVKNKCSPITICLLIFVIGMVFSLIPKSEENVAEQLKFHAYCMSKEFVEKRLKAPTTAKFASFDESIIVLGEGEDEYIVTSYVDAENSFSAMIRTKYHCLLKYHPTTEEWTLEEISGI